MVESDQPPGRSICAKPGGAALLLHMLPQFDVLIGNFRPAPLDRWTDQGEALWQASQPGDTRTTGFRPERPYRDRPGFALVPRPWAY